MSEQINRVLVDRQQSFTTAEQKTGRDNIGAAAASSLAAETAARESADNILQSAIDTKLDSSASSQFYLTSNPAGYITGVDLSPYATTAQLDAETSARTAADSALQSAVNQKLDSSASSQFYLTSNPAGYITGVDLSPYQTTAGMSAYATTGELAYKLDASASSSFQPIGDYVSSSELANYQPSGNYQTAGNYLTATPYKTMLDSITAGKGNSSTPVYVDSNGIFQTCTVATSGVQEIVNLSNTYAEVTAIINSGNEPVLAPVVDNGAGFYRRVFTGPITTPPNPVTAIKFARLAGSVFEMYTIDSDTGNWVYSSVPLTKHRHDAELYYYNTDNGDNYHVRGIQNYAVNHVAVQGHSSDICSIVIEAPTLGLNEEYDYVVVFDCSNSSGGCNVSVQGCDCEIDTKWEVDVNAVPLKTFAIDITNTYVTFTGSPQYQIEVLGNRWHRHKF